MSLLKSSEHITRSSLFVRAGQETNDSLPSSCISATISLFALFATIRPVRNACTSQLCAYVLVHLVPRPHFNSLQLEVKAQGFCTFCSSCIRIFNHNGNGLFAMRFAVLILRFSFVLQRFLCVCKGRIPYYPFKILQQVTCIGILWISTNERAGTGIFAITCTPYALRH